MKMKYCICVSGGLGLTLLNALIEKGINISCVLTDRKSTEIIEKSNKLLIPVFVGNPRDGRAAAWMKESNIEFDNILSINYLFILESDVLSKATNLAVNFHGSLLPKYRGRTPHVWAIINGETKTGITAHLMNEKCDDGDIVRQLIVPIGPDDTGASVLQKYNEQYPDLVSMVIDDIESGKVNARKQDISQATYFGKRTPDDGEINWNWQKERIRNWVRAQANPYPGAFTFVNGQKVIINHISFSDYGFVDTMTNGLVISIKEGYPLVKTPNGIVRIDDYQSDIAIREGMKLGNVELAANDLGGVILVNYTDCSLIQHKEINTLRNLPEIRKWMTNQNPIAWHDHLDFIETLSHDCNRVYYAIYKDGNLIATYNLIKEFGTTWERGIITSPQYQGKGETAIIEKMILGSLPPGKYQTITAKVKCDNIRSIRYHQKIGFVVSHQDNEYNYYKMTL